MPIASELLVGPHACKPRAVSTSWSLKSGGLGGLTYQGRTCSGRSCSDGPKGVTSNALPQTPCRSASFRSFPSFPSPQRRIMQTPSLGYYRPPRIGQLAHRVDLVYSEVIRDLSSNSVLLQVGTLTVGWSFAHSSKSFLITSHSFFRCCSCFS